jgi:hypothetical protein
MTQFLWTHKVVIESDGESDWVGIVCHRAGTEIYPVNLYPNIAERVLLRCHSIVRRSIGFLIMSWLSAYSRLVTEEEK